MSEQMTPQERFTSCLHTQACLAQHTHCKPLYDYAWVALGCWDCQHYKDRTDCPLDMSGVMRCERGCIE